MSNFLQKLQQQQEFFDDNNTEQFYDALAEAESWTNVIPFPTFAPTSSSSSSPSSSLKQRGGDNIDRNANDDDDDDLSSRNNEKNKRRNEILRRKQEQQQKEEERKLICQQQQQNSRAKKSTVATSKPVTDLECGLLRSVFGRADSVGVQDVTATSETLLPHVDLRWLIVAGSSYSSLSPLEKEMKSPSGIFSPNNSSFSQAISTHKNSTGSSNIHNKSGASGKSNKTKSSFLLKGGEERAGGGGGGDEIMNEENEAKRALFSLAPDRSKNIGNLFQNLEALSENWSKTNFPQSTTFINSPRSAVVMLRNNVDLRELVSSVARAHLVDAASSKKSAQSQTRVAGDRQHRSLQLAQRHRIEVQKAAADALSKLNSDYNALCDVTSQLDIVSALRKEHRPRPVTVIRPQAASPTSVGGGSRIVDRSEIVKKCQQSGLDATSVHQRQAELSVEQTKERTQEAARRRSEALHQLSVSQIEKADKDAALLRSQRRKSLMSDIHKREVANRQVQKVANFERIVITPSSMSNATSTFSNNNSSF